MAQNIPNPTPDQRPIQYVMLANDNGTTYTGVPTTAAFQFAATGDNQWISGVAGKMFRVVALTANVNGSTGVSWKDGTTQISGSMSWLPGALLALTGAPWAPVLQTGTPTNSLICNLSASIVFAGSITYLPTAV